MSKIRFLFGFLPLIFLIGCSTSEIYLRPDATSGTLVKPSPSGCPEVSRALSFSPPNMPWVSFRLNAVWLKEGTQLILRVDKDRNFGVASFFKSKSEESLIEERKKITYVLTSKNVNFLLFDSTGAEKKFDAAIFESPYDFSVNAKQKYWWNGNQILLSNQKLDDFTVVLPSIFVNGTPLDIPPIKFKKDIGKVAGGINC